MKLSEGKVGKKYVVNKVSGDRAIKQKLLSMGITRGEIVEIEKVAPFGDPVEVMVKGYHLSLRKEEAENIKVEEMK